MTDAGARPDDFRDYAVFGLRVRSNVDLPELFPATGAAAPDVTIELGSIPPVTRGADDGLNQVDGALVLVIPEVGRYKIEAGNRITVESEPGVPKRNVRLFLLGSAFGVLLHQRGLLPLHANAVEIEGRAVAFMGESGAGKSTLAAWFHDHGYRVIADDVCVISTNRSMGPIVLPGLPRLRLWRDMLEASGRSGTDYQRSFIGDDRFDKFDVPVPQSARPSAPITLAAAYLLSDSSASSVDRLGGVAAANAVMSHTYRGTFVRAAGRNVTHWNACIELIRKIPIFVAPKQRSWSTWKTPDSLLLEHVMANLDA